MRLSHSTPAMNGVEFLRACASFTRLPHSHSLPLALTLTLSRAPAVSPDVHLGCAALHELGRDRETPTVGGRAVRPRHARRIGNQRRAGPKKKQQNHPTSGAPGTSRRVRRLLSALSGRTIRRRDVWWRGRTDSARCKASKPRRTHVTLVSHLFYPADTPGRCGAVTLTGCTGARRPV